MDWKIEWIIGLSKPRDYQNIFQYFLRRGALKQENVKLGLDTGKKRKGERRGDTFVATSRKG